MAGKECELAGSQSLTNRLAEDASSTDSSVVRLSGVAAGSQLERMKTNLSRATDSPSGSYRNRTECSRLGDVLVGHGRFPAQQHLPALPLNQISICSPLASEAELEGCARRPASPGVRSALGEHFSRRVVQRQRSFDDAEIEVDAVRTRTKLPPLHTAPFTQRIMPILSPSPVSTPTGGRAQACSQGDEPATSGAKWNRTRHLGPLRSHPGLSLQQDFLQLRALSPPDPVSPRQAEDLAGINGDALEFLKLPRTPIANTAALGQDMQGINRRLQDTAQLEDAVVRLQEAVQQSALPPRAALCELMVQPMAPVLAPIVVPVPGGMFLCAGTGVAECSASVPSQIVGQQPKGDEQARSGTAWNRRQTRSLGTHSSARLEDTCPSLQLDGCGQRQLAIQGLELGKTADAGTLRKAIERAEKHLLATDSIAELAVAHERLRAMEESWNSLQPFSPPVLRGKAEVIVLDANAKTSAMASLAPRRKTNSTSNLWKQSTGNGFQTLRKRTDDNQEIGVLRPAAIVPASLNEKFEVANNAAARHALPLRLPQSSTQPRETRARRADKATKQTKCGNKFETALAKLEAHEDKQSGLHTTLAVSHEPECNADRIEERSLIEEGSDEEQSLTDCGLPYPVM